MIINVHAHLDRKELYSNKYWESVADGLAKRLGISKEKTIETLIKPFYSSKNFHAEGFVKVLDEVGIDKAIITAMDFMSFAIVGIIMLVLANTMIMSARERTREYAVFKTLGFSTFHLTGLILGESLLISCIGGGIGLGITFPIVAAFEQVIPKGFFPFFFIEPITVILAVTAIILIGVLSAVFPIQRAISTKIVDGFRFVG